MSTEAADTLLVADVDEEAGAELRRALGYCFERFGVYRRTFQEAGITAADVSTEDPVALLQRLPLLGADGLRELSDESLQTGRRIVDLETSSGTTGPRKRRFISQEDDLADHELLAEMFRVCGVAASDRVACIDTDPVHLMASFSRAFDLLGAESYMLCAGPDLHRGLECLPALAPSILVTVPSILEGAIGPLCRMYADASLHRPDKIIYVGEQLSDSVRRRLEACLGIEVFGYYGASETSALGIECPAHDGVHLFTDRNIFEVVPSSPGSASGEIVVTTLLQKTLPLLRYRLGDLIEVRDGHCPCGRSFPRVRVRGKAGDFVSVLGSKLGYQPVLNAVYDGSEQPGPMQLLLTREASEKLTILLPESMRRRSSRIIDSLLSSEPDLDFLVESKYLEVELSFVDTGYFHASRKRARVVDRRRSSGGDDNRD